ncbi:GNAT family N-acetyltransferase [Siccirubricoccus phaeus]|uniref:GNAT family N-acetyltransferase n=1 Tax=Siccirubricoccus phaeus TaxID=2595053 RepID=UPI0011F268C7|nr:GNAT family N-acetyltransferase [Siccirubricoccus phaeus]
MSIRPARPEDAARVAAIVEAAYTPWVAQIGQRPGPLDDDYAARVAAGETFVLEAGGAISGILVLEDHPDHLLLDNIAVDPARKGMGDGRVLLDFAEAEAKRRGFTEIRLYTHQKMAANIAIYLKRGYVETGRRVDKGLPRVFMAKLLAG